jgi:hypothetical protein
VSILDRLLRRIMPQRPEAPLVQKHRTSGWLPYDPDAGLYVREGEVTSIRPINIKRVNLQRSVTLLAGDTMNVSIVETDESGCPTHRTELTPFEIARPIKVDHVVRFEVVDHFGVDVGLGFILGQVKTR